MLKKVSFSLLLLALLSSSLYAQQTGASLTGNISDPSGAAVAGAKITITNVNTNSVYRTETDSSGIYRIPFITVGTYTLTAELQGFKKYVQTGITLVIDQKATVDVKLEIGAVAQSVTVSANAPLLQAESADRGYTVDQAKLAVLPTGELNTFESVYNAPGTTLASTSSLELSLALYATGAMSASIYNGGLGGNQFLVDGVETNIGGTTNSYNPVDNAVQEVSVEGTMYDAQYGWSTGSSINTITRGGTNNWHGNAYEYFSNTNLIANSYGNNVEGLPKSSSPFHQNQYGATFGGPILKNKLFGFVSWQKYQIITPDPFESQVPTAAEGQGNFSALYTDATKTQQVTIYDPLTTVDCSKTAAAWCNGATSGYARQSFSAEYGTNNTMPTSRLNPVALGVLKLIPPPNNSNGYNDDGNFVNLPNYREDTDVNPMWSGRADLNLSDKTHAFFRYSLSALAEYSGFMYSTPSYTDPAETTSHYPLFRNAQTYTLQVVHTFNPTTVLEFRTGMTRYEDNPGGGSEGKGYNLASLGFSPTFVSEATPWFPDFSWSDYNGAGTSGPTGFEDYKTFSTEAVLAKTRKEHNFKIGFQNYETSRNTLSPGNVAGNFGFTGTYTGATPTSSSAASGNSIADFVAGYANSGDIQVQASPALMMHQYSLFVQDDYHVSRRLTLNLGLRWDYQGAVTDRYNALLRGFCATCQSPLQVPGFPLLGGPLFAGVAPTARGIFNPKYGNFGPRFGFAYDLGHNSVLRAGYGMIYGSNFDVPGIAPGFSQTTTMLTSVSTGIPNPAVTLQNPFPTGILTPVGSKFGLAANIGNGITFADPDMNIPRTQQFSVEVQHQLGHNWLASVGYVGTKGSRLAVNQSLNALPLADLPYTYSFQTNPTGLTVGQLGASVANPFAAVPGTSPYYSLMQGTYLSPTNSTITQSRLLVPFPQFSAVTEDFEPIGTSSYNSLQAELNKRLSYGLSFTLNYTYSKLMQGNTFNNPQDAHPVWTISPDDSTHEGKVNLAWYLPMGPGKRFFSSTNAVVRRLVEGWTYGMVLQAESGFPIATPTGVEPTGATETLANSNLNLYFNTCTVNASGVLVHCPQGITTPAWKSTVADQLVTWTPYLSRLRGMNFHNPEMSASKKTKIKERYDLVFIANFHNAFNSNMWFKGPNISSTSGTFGNIAPDYESPNSDPRTIILSLKFEF